MTLLAVTKQLGFVLDIVKSDFTERIVQIPAVQTVLMAAVRGPPADAVVVAIPVGTERNVVNHVLPTATRMGVIKFLGNASTARRGISDQNAVSSVALTA